MTRVALQPSANAASRQHFENTIEKPVSVDLAAKFLPTGTVERLRDSHPDGQMMVWGAKPGERGQQVVKWNRLRPGDYIVFAADSRAFAGAVITNVFRSADFARELWGETSTANGETQTWELMFALADMEQIDVPYSVMNPLIGRAPNANVQEFNVLSEEFSDALLEYLNRSENSFQEGPTAAEVPEFDELEREYTAKRRMEQRALRAALLAGSVTQCELCGGEYLAEFLTAAHIKRRALCTDEEKAMLTAVAMLNCRFGCDELFGKGYVGVDDEGLIRVSEVLADAGVVEYAARSLAGRRASAWDSREETRPFFAFHWATDFRRPVSVR